MIAVVLFNLLIAAVGLSAIAGGIAAVTVPQFSPARRPSRFRMATARMAVSW